MQKRERVVNTSSYANTLAHRSRYVSYFSVSLLLQTDRPQSSYNRQAESNAIYYIETYVTETILCIVINFFMKMIDLYSE